MTRAKSASMLALMAGGVAAAAAVGSLTTENGRSRWYEALEKPPFQPPPFVFGPVWTALYALMTVSAHRVWGHRATADRSRSLRLWGAQLALNALWSPLFFGARRPRAALLDLGLLTVAVAAYARSAAKVDRPAAWMMAPYLGWLGFAALLNGEIVRRNPTL